MRIKSAFAMFVFSLLLALSPLAADSLIERGIDIFTTPGDGKTYYDFSRNPIPAGFFCKGSKPFTGRVAFKGLPLATATPGQLWNADTVIERLDDAAFDAKGIALTRIQFRALSMVSIAPLKTGCGAFHVYVSLGGEQRVTPMSIYRTEEAGGSFVAPLSADVRMSFIPVRPSRSKAARKLELEAAFTFPAVPIPWSFRQGAMAKRTGAVRVDTNGDQTPDALLPGTSSFAPGRPADRFTANKSGDECPRCISVSCHENEGCAHCAEEPLPWNCPMVDVCA